MGKNGKGFVTFEWRTRARARKEPTGNGDS
jgi:hypothetical protein